MVRPMTDIIVGWLFFAVILFGGSAIVVVLALFAATLIIEGTLRHIHAEEAVRIQEKPDSAHS